MIKITRFTATLAAATVVAAPLAAQDMSGFYFGGDISSFDTEFENLTVTGDGLGYGAHAGYRYAIDQTFFVEGEVFAQILDGETNTGNTEFESYYGLSAGVGAYVAPGVSVMGFAGLAEIQSENTTAGSQSDDGYLAGFSLGYDITPQNTISLRYTRVTLDGTFGDVDADIIGLRYSFRF